MLRNALYCGNPDGAKSGAPLLGCGFGSKTLPLLEFTPHLLPVGSRQTLNRFGDGCCAQTVSEASGERWKVSRGGATRRKVGN